MAGIKHHEDIMPGSPGEDQKETQEQTPESAKTSPFEEKQVTSQEAYYEQAVQNVQIIDEENEKHNFIEQAG